MSNNDLQNDMNEPDYASASSKKAAIVTSVRKLGKVLRARVKVVAVASTTSMRKLGNVLRAQVKVDVGTIGYEKDISRNDELNLNSPTSLETNELEQSENRRFKKKSNGDKLLKFAATVEEIDGKVSKRKITAKSITQARLNLSSQNLKIIKLKIIPNWYEIEFGTKIPDKLLVKFSRQMAAFTSAGISITSSLALLARSTSNKPLKSTLDFIIEDIENGDTLGSAVTAQSARFPTYYSAILNASEKSGDISEAFATLAEYGERDYASKQAVRSAMYYPAVLVLLGTAAVFLINIVVLPKFLIFFESLNADLPAPTRALMNFSAFLSTWWVVILAVMLAIVIAMVAARKTEPGRLFIDKLILKLPIFGSLVDLAALERFNRVLATLTKAGVPLTDALTLSARVVGNQLYANAINDVRKGVLNGQGLAVPMAATGVFSEVTVQVVLVGEQTGRLTEQLQQAARMHGQELDYRLKNLTSLLEPVVLLVVGGAVGFVAIALVSAMYGIYNTGDLAG